jgi:hypothetical protein
MCVDAGVYPDLVYFIASRGTNVLLSPECRMFQSRNVSTLAFLSIFEECDTTGGDIKEDNRLLEC